MRKNFRRKVDNERIFLYYKERLMNIALAQMEWNGLPDTVDRWYLEKMLLFHGKCAIYKPVGTDFWMGTDFNIDTGSFDAYGYPTQITGIDYLGHRIKTNDFYLIYDNMTRTSLMPEIDLYAGLLYEVHQTIRSNLKQQIQPYIIPTTANRKLSIDNLIDKIMGYEPFIEIRDKSLDINDIKTLDLRVDFKGNEMNELLKSIWAEALRMLGITPETSKKERLLNDEITMDRQEDVISLNSRMLNRIEFCNKFNKDNGTDITVRLSADKVNTELVLPYENKLNVSRETSESEV